METRFHHRCDALVDQDRKIGNDPVGFKCYGIAAVELPDGFLLCDRCFEIAEKEPGRLTRPTNWGREYQNELARRAIAMISARVDEIRFPNGSTVKLAPEDEPGRLRGVLPLPEQD